METSTLLQADDGRRDGASPPPDAVGHGVKSRDQAPGPDRVDLPADFIAIYDDWFEEVSRWIRALGGPESDRDDVLQEVFLVVRRRLGAFDGTNLAGWLYRITRRQVRDLQRRTWVKHIFNRNHAEEPDLLPNDDGSPDAAFEHKERQRVLQVILSRMKENRRIAFVLYEIEGLSGEEIARIQSIPLNTVWTRLHHARREFFELTAKFQRTQGIVWRTPDTVPSSAEKGAR
jgi:RNA polymerase sigma-70 factor (ECF subfamily)